MDAMRAQYGAKRGTSVFYASANKGTIKGVEGKQGGGLVDLQSQQPVSEEEALSRKMPERRMAEGVVHGLGEVTGVNDALKAYRGEMTEGEQRDFARDAFINAMQGGLGKTAGKFAPAALALMAKKMHPMYAGTGKQNFDILNDAGKAVANLQTSYIPTTKNVYVQWIGSPDESILKGVNELGPSEIRTLLKEIKKAYPEAELLSGFRISGARGSKGITDDTVVALPGASEEAKDYVKRHRARKAEYYRQTHEARRVDAEAGFRRQGGAISFADAERYATGGRLQLIMSNAPKKAGGGGLSWPGALKMIHELPAPRTPLPRGTVRPIKPGFNPHDIDSYMGVPIDRDRATVGYAQGGYTNLSPPWYARHAMKGMTTRGMLNSPIPGRTDRLPLQVAPNSYVVPADVVSALGQGNSQAGSALITKMFSGNQMNKYGGGRFRMPGVKGMKRGMFAEGGAAMETLQNPIPNPDEIAAGAGAMMDNNPAMMAIQNTINRSKAANADPPVPIVAAGGEFVLAPDQVLIAGKGDMKAGHEVLDAWVKAVRREHIKTLAKLKPPKKD